MFIPLQDEIFETPKARSVADEDAWNRGVLVGELFPWERSNPMFDVLNIDRGTGKTK